jgi:aspartyl-tRNA synthetase
MPGSIHVEAVMLRTHTCGEIRIGDAGRELTLAGWVENLRDHGGVLFVDLRDRHGITQCVFRPEDEALFAAANDLRPEWVVQVTGEVRARPEEARNPNRETGDVEVVSAKLVVLAEAEPLPIGLTDEDLSSDELRFRYRYLDLRRPEMRDAMVLRHRVLQRLRRTCTELGLVEVETPFLTRSTPEGARDYLVPSRNFRGRFYALPQSPQIFKQLFMVAGLDGYFQIVRCFRDEDLRADRQPEFTQLDVEMSFVEEDDVYAVGERIVTDLLREIAGVEHETPFRRMTYAEAMRDYGTDKPDLRFGMRIRDVSETVRGSGFGVFRETVEGGGVVRGLRAPGAASFSRKQIDGLTALVADHGAKGLAWLKVEDEIRSSFAKFLSGEERDALLAAMEAQRGDLLLLVAAPEAVAARSLGALRLELGRRLDLIPEGEHLVHWVVDFPLLEWNEDEERWDAKHHPFCSPHAEDLERLESDPGSVRAVAYDLVYNGHEILSGSIRIHRRDIQERVFRALRIGEEEAREKFGFLLEAFRYGAPPHGGFAFGLDRVVAELAGQSSIREVIAFPKTTSATCLLTGAPARVSEAQLDELGLRVEAGSGEPEGEVPN